MNSESDSDVTKNDYIILSQPQARPRRRLGPHMSMKAPGCPKAPRLRPAAERARRRRTSLRRSTSQWVTGAASGRDALAYAVVAYSVTNDFLFNGQPV